MSLSEFALGIVLDLVKSAVEKVVNYSVLGFFEKRRVERRVEDAVADIVEPLLPFLQQEGVSEEKQYRLLQTCIDELRPLSENPDQLFQGSLNGQKIFDNLYANRPLPQVVIEDGVKEAYILLCPRVAELLCKVPAAIKEWETLAWTETYRRLDELVRELRLLFNQVDELRHKPDDQADEIMNRVRRSLIQKIGLEMDITGLRGDAPLSCKLSEFFIHPIIRENIEDKEKRPKVLENTFDAFAQFVLPDQRAVIIGVAGAGKSTWTKWLQRETLSSNTVGFGIRTELRDWKRNSLPTIYDLVRETAGKHFVEELTIEVISRWLDNLSLVFILDGFDEIASSDRDAIYGWIADLCQAARGCPIVLTSRPITTDHLNRKDIFNTRWVIEPFDLPRIIEYIRHWYNYAPLLLETDRNVDAEKLASEWQDDPTLAPLTGNPLLLSTLLMVHHLDGRLPSGRSRLYQRYIDGMLGLWDDRRKLTNTTITLSFAQKKQIIRSLALYMFLQERDQLEEIAILEWLERFLKDNRISYSAIDVLCVLRERSGLIIGPGIYNFAHKSIAEYLVAEVVWEGDQSDATGQRIDRMYLFEQRDNDRWNSVIFLWAGLTAVADLVTFIDLCLDVKNWALAYGILYDQFDRINDRETRRHLIMLDLRNEQSQTLFDKSDSDLCFGLQYSPLSKKISFKSSTITMRGITGYRSYHQLVDHAIRTGTLTSADRLTTQPKELRDILWLSTAYDLTEKQDDDNLREYINTRFSSCPSDEEWCVYILSCLLKRSLFSNTDVGTMIEFCHKILPEYDGIVPFLLMSITIELLSFFPEKFIVQLQKTLAILPESGKGKTNPSWLLETRNWQDTFQDIGKSIDLFDVFRKQIEKSVQKGILPRDSIFDCALTYVDALRNQRTAFAAQMGIELEITPRDIESNTTKSPIKTDLVSNGI